MRRFSAATVAAVAVVVPVLVLAGCTPVHTEPESGIQSIVVGGTERTFTVAGDGYGNAIPVVIVLHGAGTNGAEAQSYSGMTPLAIENDFLVVYPEGSLAADIPGELSWNTGECCGAPARDGVDDVAFISALIDHLADSYPIDRTRIYLAGFSNGGMLSYALSCEPGLGIAGIAVIGGAYNVSGCASTDPVSLLLIHGVNDTTVPYDGGPTSARVAKRFGTFSNASVDDALGAFTARDNCGEPTTTPGAVADVTTWSGCPLELVAITEGTHLWPSIANEGYDASAEIVRFFELGG
jgi:polyhydroxybutyrate depolymerase